MRTKALIVTMSLKLVIFRHLSTFLRVANARNENVEVAAGGTSYLSLTPTRVDILKTSCDFQILLIMIHKCVMATNKGQGWSNQKTPLTCHRFDKQRW